MNGETQPYPIESDSWGIWLPPDTVDRLAEALDEHNLSSDGANLELAIQFGDLCTLVKQHDKRVRLNSDMLDPSE